MKPTHVNQGEMQDAETPNSDVIAIAYFKQLMAKERQKPIDEQDFDLIDECIKNIAELKGVRSEFSEEEIEERLGTLAIGTFEGKDVESDQSSPDPVLHVTAKKRTVRFRPLIAAVVAVALLVAGCLTAYATVPSFRNWILKLLDMPVGSSITNNKIEYIHTGKTTAYESVDELFTKEGLTILYPHVLPENMVMKGIKRIDIGESSKFIFMFNENSASIVVTTNFVDSNGQDAFAQKYQTGDIVAYYWEDELTESCMSVFEYDNCYYSISVKDVETMILILDNMKGV